MGRRPATLSGGERQRVAIARALATGPRLLLMDEPLAALDAPRKAEILPYLERLSRKLAIPVLYVTHAIDEVARLADHLVLLDAGRVRATGPLTELLARPDLAWAGPDEAGVVLHAVVAEHDEHYALSRLRFAGGDLWLGRVPHALGEPVRVRVPARDVSLVREAPARPASSMCCRPKSWPCTARAPPSPCAWPASTAPMRTTAARCSRASRGAAPKRWPFSPGCACMPRSRVCR